MEEPPTGSGCRKCSPATNRPSQTNPEDQDEDLVVGSCDDCVTTYLQRSAIIQSRNYPMDPLKPSASSTGIPGETTEMELPSVQTLTKALRYHSHCNEESAPDLETKAFSISQALRTQPPVDFLDNALRVAVRERHLATAQLLLRLKIHGPALPCVTQTPIHDAARLGDIHLTKLLIALGADVDPTDHDLTPLFLASRHGFLGIVRLLHKHNARIQLPGDPVEGQPIHAADNTGNPILLKFLLDHGADPNAERKLRNPVPKTPLAQASARGDTANISALLDHGADVNLEYDRRKMCALHYAVQNGHREAVNLLISGGAEVNARTICRQSVLSLAAETGDISLFIQLRDAGAKLDGLEVDTVRAAVRSKNVRMLHIVLFTLETSIPTNLDPGYLFGALESVDFQQEDWGMPGKLLQFARRSTIKSTMPKLATAMLPKAARRGNVSFVNKLLEIGVRVNSRDACGMTPLLYACLDNHESMVKLLLHAGANPNSRNSLSQGPLTIACDNRRTPLEVVKALVDAGANVHHKDVKDRPPLYYAARRNHREVVKALLQNEVYAGWGWKRAIAELHKAVTDGELPVVSALVRGGVAVDAVDNNKNTPLMLAAKKGHVQILRYLLCSGADRSLRNVNGQSAFSLARLNSHDRAAEVLCEPRNLAQSRLQRAHYRASRRFRARPAAI